MAQTLNAGTILEKMTSDERLMYIAGVVEGLAHARTIANDGDRTGEVCLYNWFYRSGNTSGKISDAFRLYPDRYAAEIIRVLARKQCGE